MNLAQAIRNCGRAWSSFHAGQTYYVDSVVGSDSNNGGLGSPWLTLAHAFAAIAGGALLLLTAGQTFAAPLLSPPSGNALAYTRISTTGRSHDPAARIAQSLPAIITAADGGPLKGLFLDNAEYVAFDNLHVQGSGRTTSSACGFSLKSSQTTNRLRGIRITACSVSDCRDGIIAWTDNPSGRVGFDALQIWGCTVRDIRRASIIVLNHNLETDTSSFAQGAVDENVNLYLGRNHCYNATGGGTDMGSGCDIRNTTGALIEYQCSHDINAIGNGETAFGAAGIGCAKSVGVVFQLFEVYNVFAPGNADGVGLDLEAGAVNCIAQNGYVHHNAGAGLFTGWAGIAATGNIFRYNVCANNLQNASVIGHGGFTKFDDTSGGVTCDVYGNTFYEPNGDAFRIRGDAGTIRLYNNVLVSKAGSACVSGTPAALIGNIYFALGGGTVTVAGYTSIAALRAAGFEAFSAVNYGVFGNPLLNAPASAPSSGTLPGAEVSTLNYFDLTASSPARGAAINYALLGINPGSVDFRGRALPSVVPDAGAVLWQ